MRNHKKYKFDSKNLIFLLQTPDAIPNLKKKKQKYIAVWEIWSNNYKTLISKDLLFDKLCFLKIKIMKHIPPLELS